jgi:hypothetical protein
MEPKWNRFLNQSLVGMSLFSPRGNLVTSTDRDTVSVEQVGSKILHHEPVVRTKVGQVGQVGQAGKKRFNQPKNKWIHFGSENAQRWNQNGTKNLEVL